MTSNRNRPRRKSAILSALASLGDKVRAALLDSAIGRLFSSYDEATDSFEHSAVYETVKDTANGQSLTKLRRLVSSVFDNSFSRSVTLSLTRAMRHCTMRFWGVFLLTFSLYVILMYFIRMYGMFYTAPISYIIVSAAAAICSIPLICDKDRSLGEALLDSRFFSWLVFGFFEIRYEDFRASGAPVKRVSVAFIFGMIFGCLTFFVSPLTVLLGIAAAFYVYFSFVSPESSFLTCLFLVPFLSFFEHPTIVLCLLVMCVLAGYTVKLVRYKRKLCFGILEGMLLLFAFLIFFGGMRNASGSVSASMPVMLILLCGMYLASNLLRTKSVLLHAVRAFALSCVICAVVGIFEYMLGMATLDWLDTDMFSHISGRSVAFFENPNVLANYLSLGAPLTLSLVSISRDNSRTRWFVGFSLILVCSVLTWSRGAWIGILAALVIMLVCMRHTAFVLGCVAVLVTFSGYIIPPSVLGRFASIGDIADSSTMYRLNIWRGCVDMAGEYGFEGIGVGEEAFLRLYPRFAIAGAETAYHSHSLWLQILLMLGVCGVVVFTVMTFFFYQRGISSVIKTDDRDLRYILYGSMSGISGILVSGIFDYTWYNYRVFFLYFVVMGFVCAANNVVRAQIKGGFHSYDW
ncbi:MAG: O-antigen ligase family protein [Clostridia bacterium]|nr:O-antigen ligase family protein [Clostridia bacterium]